ncbi:MAG: hypothetical protein H6522_00270 [Mycolicibacterium sp.]|nr:hypothetical protein [Mycolicibacterium sp.]
MWLNDGLVALQSALLAISATPVLGTGAASPSTTPTASFVLNAAGLDWETA